jgi:membrane-associated protein
MVELFNSILHIDVTLALWAQNYGALIYFILFAIIFCETGLVVTPFLPGDSLLFAVGALTATQDFLKIEQIIPLLILAAVLGDSTNFFIGQT